MYFMAFSGEDANLRGSEFYAQHPLVPLIDYKLALRMSTKSCSNSGT